MDTPLSTKFWHGERLTDMPDQLFPIWEEREK